MKNARVTAYTPDAIREAGELIAAAILKGGSGSVSWEQIVTTGTKIAEITINGEVTEVYAPNGGGSGSSVSWNEIQLSGVKIASITIDGTTYDVYAPDPDAGDIDYDNSTSGLVATNVQAAIDEVYAETHANTGDISDLNTEVGAHDTAIGNLQTAVASKANESIIAPVEASLTASRAYAIGDQFIYSGTLYTATAAITAGGTITIDGNCTASDTVTEQIEDVPKNLSYKVVESGTTIAQLKTALTALSYDDYLKSYLQIADNDLNTGVYILKPIDFRITIKQYAAYSIPFNANYASKTWNLLYNQTADTIEYVCRTQPINSSFTQTSPTISSWNIYVLQ